MKHFAEIDGMSFADQAELAKCLTPFEMVTKGQGELGLDYIDISNFMLTNGCSAKQVNSCFSFYAGKKITVTS